MKRILPPIGIAIAFILAATIWGFLSVPDGPFRALLIMGVAAAGYMALNVGANDVANNMGPAVGAKALKMGTALIVAACFDVAGAMIAGQNVISTVSENLLTRNAAFGAQSLVLVMISATLAGAIWTNASTLFGTPISTTHAVIGGIVGAGVAAAGPEIIAWPTIGTIAITWAISPVLGGMLAAALHAFIRRRITRRPDKIAASRKWVPILIGAMSGIFAAYLHALNYRPGTSIGPTLGIGVGFGVLAWFASIPWVRFRSSTLENREKQVARLFRAPLIGAAAMLSFAHGANDVSNAIAPLVAILGAIHMSPTSDATSAPFWALTTGAFGIAFGILLFGPRVIHTVGEQITKLNEVRAFCVAFAAAVTVLAASAFGLPVSSTHVAVGAVFGVGFLREYLAIRNMKGAALPLKASLVDISAINTTAEQAVLRERRSDRRFLVRRLKIARIGIAWLATLPASAALAALIYVGLSRIV